MKIFITGATGYIGQRIALYFAERGYSLHALVRSPQKAELLQHPNITLFNGDVNNSNSMDAASNGCDICLHAAGFSALYTRDKALYAKVNIDGTKQAYEVSRKNGLKKFIHISSAGVFGPSGELPVNEETKRTLPYFNEYERTKAIAGDWLISQDSTEMPVVSLNLTRVFGPGTLSEANAGTRLIDRVLKGWRIIPGDGTHIGNYVFVEDVPPACEKAIEYGQGGQQYIIGGENLSFNQYFDTIKRIAGVNQAMINMPVWAILTTAYTVQMLAFFGVQPLITPPWVRRYLYNWQIDTLKSQTALGLEPTPFEEGIIKTVNWLRRTNVESESKKELSIEAES